MSSHYTLERSTVVDAAGTTVREVLFTASRARLEAEIRALFAPRHGYAEDVLAFAWSRTLEEGENALAEHLPAFLTVRSGGATTRCPLIPDTTLSRGGVVVEVRVDQARLREATARPRAKKLAVFQVGGDSFRTLSELGEGAFLDALRSATGDAELHFALAGLLAAIPALSPPTLDAPFPFAPFFEDEGLAEHLADAADATLARWDGHIPPDTWFPLGALEEACDALGLSCMLGP